jgi:hypothetical protein
MRTWQLITSSVLVCLLGARVTADQDPVAVAMSIRTSEIRGEFVHGEMEISVVNHLSTVARNVRLRLESPLSGSLGADGVVNVGDIPVDGTAAAVADFFLDPAFLASGAPYVLRVSLLDITDTEVESVVLSLRATGGAQ